MNNLLRATMLSVATMLSMEKLGASEKQDLPVYTWGEIENGTATEIRSPAVITRDGYDDIDVTQGIVNFKPDKEAK
jgi:hypothetical protein